MWVVVGTKPQTLEIHQDVTLTGTLTLSQTLLFLSGRTRHLQPEGTACTEMTQSEKAQCTSRRTVGSSQ